METKFFKIPDKPFQLQQPMLRVCYALIPLVLVSIYLFGWRSLALVAIAFAFGIPSEAVFTFRQGKPVTAAAFVTCLIFSLSLPPTTPFWMVIIGIIIAVALGKMAFGGFGQNVFNPAMVGRCFLYITFPMEMTNTWMEPMWGGLAGFAHWSNPADAVTRATPLMALRSGVSLPLEGLFFGLIPGSLGETSAFLILLGGAYIVYKKAASWRLVISCLLGGLLTSGCLHFFGQATMAPPIPALISGSFLFGAFFVVTEPVSGAKTKAGQWIYGFMIGGLTMVLRAFSNFSGGIMFSVLIMNAFVPLLDQTVRQIQASRKVKH
jgi:Na+-transporting NADH:ubiquinone oxidoreductase subunit B